MAGPHNWLYGAGPEGYYDGYFWYKPPPPETRSGLTRILNPNGPVSSGHAGREGSQHRDRPVFAETDSAILAEHSEQALSVSRHGRLATPISCSCMNPCAACRHVLSLCASVTSHHELDSTAGGEPADKTCRSGHHRQIRDRRAYRMSSIDIRPRARDRRDGSRSRSGLPHDRLGAGPNGGSDDRRHCSLPPGGSPISAPRRLYSWLARVPGLMARRRAPADLASFLLSRGLWLILLEVLVISTAASFSPTGITALGGRIYVGLQVIFVIGAGMVALAGAQFLGRRACLAIGAAIVLGHNLLDAFWPGASSTGNHRASVGGTTCTTGVRDRPVLGLSSPTRSFRGSA